MNGIVRIALSRPYTFVVLALLILIIGPLAAMRTPTDIFPDIRIPVIGVVWQYTGLPPDQMSGRITTPFERSLTTTVNDIEHIVANSYNGFGIVKIFFQPNVDIRTANAQVTAISQTLLKQLPPGATPPLILNYSASTVPIIQLALSGEGLTEQNLADIGVNQLRTPLVTVPGAAIPYPYGGKSRQIQIDLDPTALQSRGLSGQDVANTLARRSAISNTPSSSTIRRSRSPNSATSRSRPSTAPWSTSVTSPPCATAIRRRPTSCTSTAIARC
jgi:multidrug efflux pump subunit AcrB